MSTRVVPRRLVCRDAVQVQTSHDNQAPRFKEGASTFRVVMENVAADDTDDSATDATADNIGMPGRLLRMLMTTR